MKCRDIVGNGVDGNGALARGDEILGQGGTNPAKSTQSEDRSQSDGKNWVRRLLEVESAAGFLGEIPH